MVRPLHVALCASVALVLAVPVEMIWQSFALRPGSGLPWPDSKSDEKDLIIMSCAASVLGLLGLVVIAVVTAVVSIRAASRK